MKCQKCGYALWNLPNPRCPECGEEFRVTDWDFEPGSVELHCNKCRAALPHERHREPPHRCPACDQLIDWTSVLVVPKDHTSARRRKPDGTWHGIPSGLTVLLILGLFSCSGCLFAPLAASHIEFPVFLLSVIILACASLFALDLWRRRHRRNALFIWIAVAVIALGSLAWFVVEQSIDDERRRWTVRQRVALRELGQASTAYMHEHNVLPLHPLMLLGEFVDGEAFIAYGRGPDPVTVPIGRQSLQDWISRRGLQEELQAQIAGDLSRGEEWVRVGHFYFSTAAAAWNAYDDGHYGGEVVVAIGPTHPRCGWRVALHSHGGVWMITKDEVDAENIRRKSLGLEPLPEF